MRLNFLHLCGCIYAAPKFTLQLSPDKYYITESNPHALATTADPANVLCRFLEIDRAESKQPTGVELKVTNVEVDGNFVAGDGSAKRMTITCEVQNDFTIVAGS